MKSVRIANAGGFWGDWLEAPKRQILGGPIDYLTLDYLAEYTMSMLARQRAAHPERGFVYDFVRMCDEMLPEIVSRGVRVIANAGGVNPTGCARAVFEIAKKHGLSDKVRIAAISGDDLQAELKNLKASGESFSHFETGADFSAVQSKIQSANAYIGSQPIVDALSAGANIVITGRVYDAGLVVGALRHEFAWDAADYDALALGVVTGHVLECGAQATGGNCSSDWKALPDPAHIGFPIAEVSENLVSVIYKHPGTGGKVSAPSVKEQLLYEIGDPKKYITPDVVADFTTIALKEVGENKVQLSTIKGSVPPVTLKVSMAYAAGFRAEGTLLFSWPQSAEKAKAADQIIRTRLNDLGLHFDEICTEFVGWNAAHGRKTTIVPDEVLLRMAVRSSDKKAVERFVREIPPLVLSGPPGVSGYAGDRPGAQEIFAYWPTLVSREKVQPKVELL